MGENRRQKEDPKSKSPAVSGEGAEGKFLKTSHRQSGAGQELPRNYGRPRDQMENNNGNSPITPSPRQLLAPVPNQGNKMNTKIFERNMVFSPASLQQKLLDIRIRKKSRGKTTILYASLNVVKVFRSVHDSTLKSHNINISL